MRIVRNFILYLILLLFSVSVQAQKKDFRTWYSVEIEGEGFNLIDYSITPELRLWDNSSRFEGFLAEADVSVPVIKILRFGLNYRYQTDFEKENHIRQTNRFGIYAEASQKLQDFKFTYRALYLREYTDMYNSEKGFIPLVQHRHKISVKYRRKKWKIEPSVSAEMFFTLNPEWIASQEKLRVTAEVQYAFSKKLKLGLGYKYQQEYYETNPLTSHIVSLEFDIKI
jgi:hypothetical protein